jgi:Low affinity iron permease
VSPFDRFAEAAARFVSRAWFFVLCVLLIVIWAPSLPLFGDVDTWQLIINTATTIVTFLLVALLQNSQWRTSEAINRKLDATADGLADTMESLAALMERMDVGGHEAELLRQARDLRDTVGVEKRISSSKEHDTTAA